MENEEIKKPEDYDAFWEEIRSFFKDRKVSNKELTELKEPYYDKRTGQIQLKIPKIFTLKANLPKEVGFAMTVNPGQKTKELIDSSKLVIFSVDKNAAKFYDEQEKAFKQH